MSDELRRRLDDAREAFDASFVEPVRTPAPPGQRLLCVRGGERWLALRLDDVARVERCPPLTALPSVPSSCGLGLVRGALVAVYPIETVVADHGPLAGRRWLATCRTDPTVAVAFDEIRRLVEVPRVSRDKGRHVCAIEGKTWLIANLGEWAAHPGDEGG